MRVALVVAGELSTTSGGYLYDRRLLERLTERGHDVEVISIPHRSYGGRLLENVRTRAAPSSDVDVVVEDGLAHPALLRTNRQLDRPVVALLHMVASATVDGIRRRAVGAVERRFLRSVDAAIHNSVDTETRACRLDAPERSVVVPPAGDRFDPEIGPAAIGRRAHEGALEIAFLGNVVERKGLRPLVDGLARTELDWRLTIVGDPTVEPRYVERVRGRARSAGIENRIEWTGWRSDESVAETLRTTDVLAVPSSYEPFGIVYLEAMGFGCVPIAARNGGADEFVRDGETGYTVHPEPAVIADRIGRLADRDRLERMGIAARRTYERQPGWEQRLDRAVDFLEAV